MSSFIDALRGEIVRSKNKNYGIENYDQFRFGPLTNGVSIHRLLKKLVKNLLGYNHRQFAKLVNEPTGMIRQYERDLEFLYANLNHQGKKLIAQLICYRLLGFRKVRLDFNNEEYKESLALASSLKDTKDTLDPHFKHFILHKFDLMPIGYDLRLYFRPPGIVADFIAQQYAYRIDGESVVEAEKGDIVFDLGACWGDTALYFAWEVAESGKVFSFEFIPENIKLFKRNVALNPRFEKSIYLVQNPVSNSSNETVYFKDNGPGSKVELSSFEGYTGTALTVSIDDFVLRNAIDRVDFIKMDIEGAEPLALKGALNTITRFRPKLAIAIYHSLDDFVGIPKWILGLNLGYEIFIDHFTIHAEETICFARCIDR